MDAHEKEAGEAGENDAIAAFKDMEKENGPLVAMRGIALMGALAKALQYADKETLQATKKHLIRMIERGVEFAE